MKTRYENAVTISLFELGKVGENLECGLIMHMNFSLTLVYHDHDPAKTFISYLKNLISSETCLCPGVPVALAGLTYIMLFSRHLLPGKTTGTSSGTNPEDFMIGALVLSGEYSLRSPRLFMASHITANPTNSHQMETHLQCLRSHNIVILVASAPRDLGRFSCGWQECGGSWAPRPTRPVRCIDSGGDHAFRRSTHCLFHR